MNTQRLCSALSLAAILALEPAPADAAEKAEKTAGTVLLELRTSEPGGKPTKAHLLVPLRAAVDDHHPWTDAQVRFSSGEVHDCRFRLRGQDDGATEIDVRCADPRDRPVLEVHTSRKLGKNKRVPLASVKRMDGHTLEVSATLR